MPQGVIELAEYLGNPAIYAILIIAVVIWSAQSYIKIRRSWSEYRLADARDTAKLVDELAESTPTSVNVVEIKRQILHRIGISDVSPTAVENAKEWQLTVPPHAPLNDLKRPYSGLFVPEPMLIVSGCGAIVMLIANTVGTYLDGNRVLIAIVASFTLGLFTFKARRPWTMRITYFLLISVTIFSLASGFNSLGSAATNPLRW